MNDFAQDTKARLVRNATDTELQEATSGFMSASIRAPSLSPRNKVRRSRTL